MGMYVANGENLADTTIIFNVGLLGEALRKGSINVTSKLTLIVLMWRIG